MDEELLRLLRSLAPEDWSRPASTAWSVREVAAHLLDGNLRRLALDRDAFTPDVEPPGTGQFDDVLAYLDRLNDDWIRAAERLSPRVIVDLLEVTDGWTLEHYSDLDPEAPARFPVTWAGRGESPAWLDVARDYTEKWHHQHQIRAAVGAPELDDPALLEPLLRTLVRAVPPAYRDLDAGRGTTVGISATGRVRLEWAVRAEGDGWTLYEVVDGLAADARVRMDARFLWRLLLRSDIEAVRENAVLGGPGRLTDPLFGAVGVMVSRPSPGPGRNV